MSINAVGDATRVVITQAMQQIASKIASDHTADAPPKVCVILSGGLDSSIAALVSKDFLDVSGAFTILVKDEKATDREYAGPVFAVTLGGRPNTDHSILEPKFDTLLETELPHCVRVLKTFDPMQLRNSIAISHALRAASAAGYTVALTGDAADELFGGYSFTHDMDDDAWLINRDTMAKLMQFSSVPLGESFGVHVFSPFLQNIVVNHAVGLAKPDCVGPLPTANGDIITGKLPLRQAFPELSTTSQWRKKDPIEIGCGTTALGDRPWLGSDTPPGHVSSLLSDEEFRRDQKETLEIDKIIIRDKEHLYYYKEFRRQFPADSDIDGLIRWGSDPCPACGYQLNHPLQTFCITCGHYDAQLKSRKQN